MPSLLTQQVRLQRVVLIGDQNGYRRIAGEGVVTGRSGPVEGMER